MKSSMTTTSVVGGASFGPSAAFPLEIRTADTILDWKSTPRKEKVSLPASAGTKNVPSGASATSKNVIELVVGRSTSLKTAPKPLTSAGVADPATKNVTSTMFEPRAVKRRGALKGAKTVG